MTLTDAEKQAHAAITDLLGGQVQVYFGITASSQAAVTSATRAGLLPGTPAVAEFVPGLRSSARAS